MTTSKKSDEKYFVHDELNGDIDYFDTFNEALEHSKKIISENGDDGWPEELFDGAVKVGIVTHESAKTNERQPLEGEYMPKEWNYLCNVEMIEVSNSCAERAIDKETVKLLIKEIIKLKDMAFPIRETEDDRDLMELLGELNEQPTRK